MGGQERRIHKVNLMGGFPGSKQCAQTGKPKPPQVRRESVLVLWSALPSEASPYSDRRESDAEILWSDTRSLMRRYTAWSPQQKAEAAEVSDINSYPM